jgi:hypothetical protein
MVPRSCACAFSNALDISNIRTTRFLRFIIISPYLLWHSFGPVARGLTSFEVFARPACPQGLKKGRVIVHVDRISKAKVFISLIISTLDVADNASEKPKANSSIEPRSKLDAHFSYLTHRTECFPRIRSRGWPVDAPPGMDSEKSG